MRILSTRFHFLWLVVAVGFISFAPLSSASTSGRLASLPPKHASQRRQGKIDNSSVTKGGSTVKHDNNKNNNKIHESTTALARGGSVSPQTQAIAGVVVMGLMEQVVRKTFLKFKIEFPSQLGGCMILLTFMLLAEGILPGWGESVYDQLAPGAALLAKWLPSFFVPGLTMLPLAPSIGNGVEVAKVLAVVILGFLYTLSTVGFTVLGLRTVQGAVTTSPPKGPTLSTSSSSSSSTSIAPVKPFRDETMNQLLQGVAVFGVASVVLSKTDQFAKYQTIVRTIFLGFTTVGAYVWGARLPPSFTSLVHPLVTSTALTWVAVLAYAKLTGSTFLNVLRTYKVGTLAPLKTGAGDVLLHLLGPAVVSFAVSMYSRKKLLSDNLLVVATAIFVSSIGGLFGTAAFVRAIELGGKTGGRLVRLSVLCRNVTTALAIVVTNMLGGDISIVAVVVVLTGIIGATFGRTILDTLRIQDPVSRGLAIGSSSQGLGVASLAGEPDAFPFAAMSMVLTAISATLLVSIPSVKTTLINIATGGTPIP